MAKALAQIDDKLSEFIRRQKMFFVATAPLSGAGHVNISPKGLDTLLVLDSTTVAYLDLVGSGIETVAHVRENGRIVLMLCAFEGPPKTVRLHGRAEVVEPADPRFDQLVERFPKCPGIRSVILVHCTRIATSCGFGVPLYRFEGQRPDLARWASAQGEDKLKEYQAQANSASLDGLAGLRQAAEN